nr:DMT family transporter [Actinomycetota bacterium]
MSPRGWALFAAMSIIWGIPYLLIKVAVDGVSAPVLVFARTAIGAAVLLPPTASRAAWAPVLRKWRPVLVFAFFEIIAAWLLLSDAERRISSSLTGLLIAAAPIIAAVLDRLTGGEGRLSGKRIAGLAVGLAGVAVLAGPAMTGGSAWPVSEVLLVALCYAIAPLVAARYLADVPTLPMTAACLGVAAVVYV